MKSNVLGLLVCVLTVMFLSISCSDGSDLSYKVGDKGPGGGTIFYVSAAGFTVQMVDESENYTAHYLEVAPEDVGSGTVRWSTDLNTIPGVTASWLSTRVAGNGKKDTQLIVAYLDGKETSTAAQLCDDYSTNNGTSDWFLPSQGELNLLYLSKVGGIPSSDTAHWYWSSSQVPEDGSCAWMQNFINGTTTLDSKSYLCFARAIRAF